MTLDMKKGEEVTHLYKVLTHWIGR